VRVLLATLLATLIACTADTPVDRDDPAPRGSADTGAGWGPCRPPAFELGEGAAEHVALSDTVTMVHGAQGGWHVDVSGRLRGFGPRVAVAPAVTRVSDGLVLAGEQLPTYVEPEPVDDCTGEFAGVRAFLDDHDPSPQTALEFLCAVDGQRFTVEVQVTDVGSATRLVRSAEVTLRADPRDYCDLL